MVGQPQQRKRARTKNNDNNKKRSDVVAGIELSVMEGEAGFARTTPLPEEGHE